MTFAGEGLVQQTMWAFWGTWISSEMRWLWPLAEAMSSRTGSSRMWRA